MIGTTYGAGDGSTTFKLPDLRGEFLRGFDDARGVDIGRSLGSSQGDAIRNMTGSFYFAESNPNGAHIGTTSSTSGVFSPFSTANSQRNVSTTAVTNVQTNYGVSMNASAQVPTSSENRPRNIALLACIKI